MSRITIYTTALCPYCHRAKAILKKKGVAFTEIDVGKDPKKRQEMTDRAGGRRTVPQIFLDGHYLGDSDELARLEREGRLDDLLKR